MTYSLFWASPALPFVQKQTPISVPAGAVVSNMASLRFTGKGATNYGKIQQENLLRLLENFAADTEPNNPTVGQTWYDTATSTLKVCVATPPLSVSPTGDWQQLKGIQITPVSGPPPAPAALGDLWYSLTGTASGILYTYTGIGRYPKTDWDAYAAGYWPAPATLELQVLLNQSAFVGVDTNELYIHGTTAGLPADVAGTILLDSVVTAVPAGPAYTTQPVIDGLIVVDPTATMVSVTPGHMYFVVRQFDDGRWFYDNDATLVEFTPTSAMYAIGVCTVAEQDDNDPPGVTAATMWSAAIRLTNIAQVPATLVGGAVGGWEQIWPTVEIAGGRQEYEYMYGQLASLIGNPIAFGGSAAEGKSIQYITNFRVLDASMQSNFLALLPNDPNVVAPGGDLGQLKAEPNSQDWDALLSACRYAVNRLELPFGTPSDVAVYPFVQDGRLGPLIPFSDIRELPAERKVRAHVGTITLISQYQETSNVLRAAINNRYVAKGMLGTSSTAGSGGTPSIANVSVVTSNQASYNAAAASFAGTVTHGLAYAFPHANPDLESFFFSAGAIQLQMTHTPSGSPTAFDTSLQTITSTSGRVRITADKTYQMSTSPTPGLVAVPGSAGFKNLSASSIVLATMTNGASSIVIRGVRENLWTVAIYVDIVAGGATTGSFGVLWSYIHDTESYNNPGPTPVYPTPDVNVTGTHKRGSVLFV